MILTGGRNKSINEQRKIEYGSIKKKYYTKYKLKNKQVILINNIK